MNLTESAAAAVYAAFSCAAHCHSAGERFLAPGLHFCA